MSTYMANFGPPPDASVAEPPPDVAAVDPAPPTVDNPTVVANSGSLCQNSLSEFWSSL